MYPIPIHPARPHDDLGRSALPDAPVLADRPRRHPLRGGRLAVANVLHALARAVEPAPRGRARVSTDPGGCA